MAIPSRQIGWGTEDNLLWQISKQLERLTQVTGNAVATTSSTSTTVAPTTTTTTTLPVYQVFTALLTQSGGDVPSGNGSDDPYPLIIGVTYYISSNDGTGDFTNVGAPNNNVGTYFIATGTTPNSWGTPGDVQLGYNTGAPVAILLENTIGNVWFTYNNIGNYVCNFSPIANFNKTFCLATNNDSAQNYNIGPLEIGSYINGQVNIINWDLNGNLFNGMYQAIEIRVYN